MPSRGMTLGVFVAVGCLATAAAAQGEADRRVSGTVRDERGNAIASADVRIVACTTGHAPLVVAIGLADAPLPSTRSARDGTWSLVLTAEHDLFAPDSHQPLALVVTATEHQPWRELLPAPAALYRGSDVVLRARSPAEDATVLVPDAPPGAIVRVRRADERGLAMSGGRPPGEVLDLAVPAAGKLVVNVPLLPSPLALAAGARGAGLAWSAQLLVAGGSSPAVPIAAGETVTLRPLPMRPARAARSTDGSIPTVRRVLARLPDGAMHWFPSAAEGVADDAVTPVLAVEVSRSDGRTWIAPWPEVGDAPAGSQPTALQFRDPTGAAVRDVTVFWCAATGLMSTPWTGGDLLPRTVARRERVSAASLPITRVDEQPCAWIAAPGHVSRFVLDVRTLAAAGGVATVVLIPTEREFTVRVRDAKGGPLAGARVRCWQANDALDGAHARRGVFLASDGTLPRTDVDGECRLPFTGTMPNVDVVLEEHAVAGTFDPKTSTYAFVATRLARWRVRTATADGKPMPFAVVGCNVDLSSDGSGTMFTTHQVCTDSRGEGTLLAPADAKPQLGPSWLGSFGQSGTPLRADAVTTIAVDEEATVTVRMPPNPMPWVRYQLFWRRSIAGQPLGGEGYDEPHAGRDWWFRWPRDLDLWVTDSPDAPPVAIARAAIDALLVRIDGTKVARTTPLTLGGDVPADLAALRAVPEAIDGHRIAGLGGQYLAPDRSTLHLQTSDLLAHDVVLLHPECVPAPVAIAAGDAGRQPVTATLVRGAPLTLTVRFNQPRAGRREFLVAMRGHERIAAAELFDARLATDEVTKGIELRAPFALPPGKVTLQIGWLPAQEIVVSHTAPVRATFVER
jgi:hypothetical protein